MTASLPRSLLSSAALACLVAAQEQRTEAVITAEGVFYRSQDGITPGPLGPNPSPPGLRWTYPHPNWVTRSVSVGNHGTMAWLAQNQNNERLSLVSTTDASSNPPAFVYEIDKLGADGISVKAADDSPACVVVTTTGGASVVDYHTCFRTAPRFSLNYNNSVSGVLATISDDGRYVAVGFSPTAMSAQIDVYDAAAATPTTPIAMLGASTHSLRNLDISGDGSTVLMATQTDNHVFDVQSGLEIFTDSSTVSHDAHAINADGSVWGRGGFNPVRAWVRSGGTYNLVLDFRDTSLGFPVFTAADVSRDGSTFVAAAYDAQSSARLRVFCWRLTATGSTLLWTYASDGTGTVQTTPQAVSISDDGQLIAVGTWGDGNNVHHEALLFARDGGPVPIATVDTPGSVFDLDLSGDGQFLVIGTKSVHANVFGRGGEGYSYDVGGQDHWLVGTSSIGRSIALNTGGNPGESVFLAFSSGFGTPLTVPGIAGTFDLDLAGLFGIFFVGTVPGSGVQTTNVGVPAVNALVGRSLYTQPLRGAPFEFENTLLLPITP